MLYVIDYLKPWGWSMTESRPLKDRRIVDPFLDRRSGDDRRKVYDLDFFEQGGIERRSMIEIRNKGDRRIQWVNVSEWSSVSCKTKSSVE
jgi:hypothetical protein